MNRFGSLRKYILLGGVLAIGLVGCGKSSTTTAPPAQVPADAKTPDRAAKGGPKDKDSLTPAAGGFKQGE